MSTIVAKDSAHHTQVLSFAEKMGLSEQLREKLEYLENFAGGENTRCTLYKDFAPASYEFVMEFRKNADAPWEYWFNGGLIYHGNHDCFGSGAGPTFAVCLEPTNGWSIHT